VYAQTQAGYQFAETGFKSCLMLRRLAQNKVNNMAHTGPENMQGQGCKALVHFAVNDDNQTLIAVTGAISVVLAAMHAHTGHEGLQVTCCLALANLANNNLDNPTTIAAAGGHPDGCAALEIIRCSESDVTQQKQIKEQGGVVVVQAAMMASGATAQCTSSGLILLGKLQRV